MKVFHLITTIEPGGAEKQLMHLVHEQVKSNNIVYVAYLKGNGTLEVHFAETGVRLIKSIANKSILIQCFLLWKLIKTLEPDIVHCHLPRSEGIGALLKRTRNFKLILSKHNSEKFWPTGIASFSRVLATYVNNKAEAIICISNATKDYLQAIGELKEEEKLAIVHYGLPPLKDLDIYKNQVISSEGIRLLTFSRLVPQKNLKHLILAVSSLRLSHKNISLYIYGDGALRDELQSQIDDLDLMGEVKILSPVLHSDEILAKCDIFLLVSNYEGFGLSVLEALRLKRPVIASKNGALEEVLGSEYPYLVDSSSPQEIANAILKVWSDSLSGNIPNLEKIYNRFSIEEKSLEIASVYQSLF